MTTLQTQPVRPSGASAPDRFTLDARQRAWLTAAGLALALVWSWWTTLQTMAERWASDPQYTHGFLVPVFAAVVLWSRRGQLAEVRWQPSPWGLPLLGFGLGLRMAAVMMDIEPLDAFALLPTLAGLVLFVGGGGLFRWAWPGVAFLGFMLPLPFTIEAALAQPLRRLATIVSTYALQTLGCPAFAEGNIIRIDDISLGVAEACSGLGMLLTFFALSTAFAVVVPAPRVERWVLVASAVPIAVIANVIRITATGVVAHWWGSEAARTVMHDLAGWLMMPLALGLLWLELRLLANLFLDESAEGKPLPLWQ